MIEQTVNVLKALAEPNRLKIVRMLQEREMCVCELAAVLNVSQPRISQHLKVLRQADLLNERRDGTRSFFSLNGRLAGGRIIDFEALSGASLGNITGLENETVRLRNLDSNEDVQACKQVDQVRRIS